MATRRRQRAPWPLPSPACIDGDAAHADVATWGVARLTLVTHWWRRATASVRERLWRRPIEPLCAGNTRARAWERRRAHARVLALLWQRTTRRARAR